EHPLEQLQIAWHKYPVEARQRHYATLNWLRPCLLFCERFSDFKLPLAPLLRRPGIAGELQFPIFTPTRKKPLRDMVD
ncbi:hypothetical protein, partial [Mesorhizobium sp. M1C.F.Ca.ET.192.01.1.1]|uniref:hypothetical protein n=1 Tax=Mesorhizobium sp. M1C.F.Ca.ET.192.01.1.1 TaxID=2496667 RepID=UPI001AEF1E61